MENQSLESKRIGKRAGRVCAYIFVNMNVFKLVHFFDLRWVDGFSILYVRGDGLINKHRVQRVMTKKDEQGVLVKNEKIAQKNLNVNPTIYQNNNSK